MTIFHDPFKIPLAEVQPAKNTSRRAKRQALAPDAPEDTGDLDRKLSFEPLNDDGNGQRLIGRFGKDLMFVDRNGWYAWNGFVWVGNDEGYAKAFKAAQQTSRLIIKEAKALEKAIAKDASLASQERIDRLLQWSGQSGNTIRLKGMLTNAEQHLRRGIDELDRNEFLVACPNGTLVLSSKVTFRESRREDMITRAIAIEYDPAATAPRFGTFLEQIMPEREDRDHTQRIFGYSLTGSIREHKMFMFFGMGRNGKSTLINQVRHVLGSYGASTPVQTFLAKQSQGSGGEASPHLARLPGVRLVTASEPPEGGRLDESAVKEMTGGEGMAARNLMQGFFEFRPSFKMVISTNYRPTIRGVDDGIWARILLVPFMVRIAKEDIDPELDRKLRAEAQGILNWIVAGCEDWFDEGLNPPASAIAAVEDYRAGEDPVGEFLKSRCDRYPLDYLDPNTQRPWETNQKALRDAYEEWCKAEGLDAMTPKTFGMKLIGRGIPRRRSNGSTFYQGVVLKGVTLHGRDKD